MVVCVCVCEVWGVSDGAKFVWPGCRFWCPLSLSTANCMLNSLNNEYYHWWWWFTWNSFLFSLVKSFKPFISLIIVSVKHIVTENQITRALAVAGWTDRCLYLVSVLLIAYRMGITCLLFLTPKSLHHHATLKFTYFTLDSESPWLYVVWWPKGCD